MLGGLLLNVRASDDMKNRCRFTSARFHLVRPSLHLDLTVFIKRRAIARLIRIRVMAGRQAEWPIARRATSCRVGVRAASLRTEATQHLRDVAQCSSVYHRE
jgi:hypothetical protein